MRVVNPRIPREAIHPGSLGPWRLVTPLPSWGGAGGGLMAYGSLDVEAQLQHYALADHVAGAVGIFPSRLVAEANDLPALPD